MKTFYKWISENIIDTGDITHQVGVQSGRGEGEFPAGFQKIKDKRPLGTIIGDYIRKFLLNFNPSKENEPKVKDIVDNVYLLYRNPKSIDDFISQGFSELYDQYVDKIKNLILTFKDISNLNKRDGKYDKYLQKALDANKGLYGLDGVFFDTTRAIILKIARLYDQEVFFLNKEEMETSIINIIYDFELDRSLIEKVKRALNNFQFSNKPHRFNIQNILNPLVSLNAFDDVAIEGVMKSLKNLQIMSQFLGQNTELADLIKTMIREIESQS